MLPYIEKFIISRHKNLYQAWPDLITIDDNRLLCVYCRCEHHMHRGKTQIMLSVSDDLGRSWQDPVGLTDVSTGIGYWNCPRLTRLKDGSIIVSVDWIESKEEATGQVHFLKSSDNGRTWSKPRPSCIAGIVPDKILELSNGQWFTTVHHTDSELKKLTPTVWSSNDKGETWNGPITVARDLELNLCEGCLVPVDDKLVILLRENSCLGRPCYKCISTDNGLTWSEPLEFPLPGCHRPVGGYLKSGEVFITYRFSQGGKMEFGVFSQNFFGALTDVKSLLAEDYNHAITKIIPIDHDYAKVSDLGYSGWVECGEELIIANYIVDDYSHGYICGYRINRHEIRQY